MSGGLLAVVIKHGKRNGSLTILNNEVISLNILTPLVDDMAKGRTTNNGQNFGKPMNKILVNNVQGSEDQWPKFW